MGQKIFLIILPQKIHIKHVSVNSYAVMDAVIMMGVLLKHVIFAGMAHKTRSINEVAPGRFELPYSGPEPDILSQLFDR